ncbi:MAG TPA: transketolase C-terminal domain-containing protein [Burkholderiales bacterium]|nr:transketolase C-terminal domain-containing protein [Burkholderiales bacterium]
MSGAAVSSSRLSYGSAICSAFEYLLSRHPEVFVIGQGLWSPWYVGNSMTDLDKVFGTERIIDTPVSELACTGAAVGASLFGYRPIVVHPRMDFMLYGVDAIVNQAAKWSHMVGGQAHPAVTIRSIINRGGEQGAQHSQALHAWFAHIPGLRVVMPATPRDARDLLIAAVLCDDPVVYIDDRWLYHLEEELPPISKPDLLREGPLVTRPGRDVTLVGSGYTAYQCLQAARDLESRGISAEVVDLRVINPLDSRPIADSVARTGRLCVVDGGWRNCGLAGEIIARVTESLEPAAFKARPARLTLPDAPAPTSRALESDYYVKTDDIVAAAVRLTAEMGVLVE